MKNTSAIIVNIIANNNMIMPKPCVPAPKHIGTKNMSMHPPTPTLVLVGVYLSSEKTVNIIDNAININPMNTIMKPNITSLNGLLPLW